MQFDATASAHPPPPTPANGVAYRPEVDGVRALAVLSVILFHAQLGPFNGGFLGVDVFFVISGFLITGILLREQAQGVLSLARFYARRARRIGPALLAMCAACIPVALFVMSGPELQDFGRLLASTAIGASNMVLAASSGYFDLPSEGRPLLHTWSLAVEEQFYLVFPLLLIAASRLRRRHLGWLLSALALVSLLAAEWGRRRYPGANFFLAPGRAWELLAGSIGALLFERAATLPRHARQGLALAGLAAIVASFLVFDQNTPTPSLRVLLPVLGTVAVLLFATHDTVAGRLLALRPVAAIGLVSYSAYLWHQPLLAFSRLYLDMPLPAWWRIATIAITFVLAALSWKYVEQPFRFAHPAGPRKTLSLAFVASAAAVVVGVAAMQLAPQAVQPLPTQVSAAFENAPRTRTCFDIPYAHLHPAGWCGVNAGAEARPSFMLFGDSHALQVLEAFEESARATGRSGVFVGYSGCPPLLQVVSLTSQDVTDRNCEALNQAVFEYLRHAGIRDLYLVSKWSYYTDLLQGTGYLQALGRRRNEPRTVQNSRAAFAFGYEATIRAYAALGLRIHVLEQVPQQLYDPRAVYERVVEAEERAPEVLAAWSVPLARHHAQQAFPTSVLRRRDLPQREILNVDSVFCDAQRCAIGTATQPYYRDFSHLSAAGARLLVPTFTASLAR